MINYDHPGSVLLFLLLVLLSFLFLLLLAGRWLRRAWIHFLRLLPLHWPNANHSSFHLACKKSRINQWQSSSRNSLAPNKQLFEMAMYRGNQLNRPPLVSGHRILQWWWAQWACRQMWSSHLLSHPPRRELIIFDSKSVRNTDWTAFGRMKAEIISTLARAMIGIWNAPFQAGATDWRLASDTHKLLLYIYSIYNIIIIINIRISK